MPISREGKFLVFRDLAHVPSLGLESERLDECLSEIKGKRIKGAFGSPPYGFLERTLDVLLDIRWLEAIWFWDVDLENIDALYALDSLKFFGVHPKRPAIDFSRLALLETAVWFHKAKDRGMKDQVALKTLNVWHYKSERTDFSELELPGNLNELKIYWSNSKSLTGLCPLPNLRRLEIHRCRNLVDVALIPTLFPNLEHLIIDACGPISEIDSRFIGSQLPSLTFASVQGRTLV